MRIRSLALVLALTASGCATDAGCVAVPLTQIVTWDKLDFAGPWVLRSELIEADAPFEAGATSDGTVVVFDAQENFLYVVDGSGEPRLVFEIAGHYSIGALAGTGEPCLQGDDPRPWPERRYMRVDFAEQLLTGEALRVLPAGEWRVDSAFALEDDDLASPPRLEREEAGPTLSFELRARYVVLLTSTTPAASLLVRHRLERP